MMNMDEIHATTLKLDHFYRLPSVHFDEISENIIPAYIKVYYDSRALIHMHTLG